MARNTVAVNEKTGEEKNAVHTIFRQRALCGNVEYNVVVN
jgi:hypothetical protein